MKKFRYILEPGSKKHLCPQCGQKRFVRYVDSNSGEYLPKKYGRCDREDNCGYHLNPYEDGFVKIREPEGGNNYALSGNLPNNDHSTPEETFTIAVPAYIPYEVLNQSLRGYEQNTFIQNLLYNVNFPVDIIDIEKVISLYYLGSICDGYRRGAITFPFIDGNGNIRAVQVKQFDGANHTAATDYLHSIIEKQCHDQDKPIPNWLQDYRRSENKVSCLFGEHLLRRYPSNPVALVEAPKTAIYGSLYFGLLQGTEDLIWLATGGRSYFTSSRIQALKGREVYVFPDLSIDGNTYQEWERKSTEYEKQLPGTKFVISDLLERLASESDKQMGKDLADFLIQYDWRKFRKQHQPVTPTPVTVSKSEDDPASIHETADLPKKTTHTTNGSQHSIKSNRQIPHKANPAPEDWEKEIAELEQYVRNVTFPDTPFDLNEHSTILDFDKYVSTHLSSLKAHNGNPFFKSHLTRMQQLRESINKMN